MSSLEPPLTRASLFSPLRAAPLSETKLQYGTAGALQVSGGEAQYGSNAATHKLTSSLHSALRPGEFGLVSERPAIVATLERAAVGRADPNRAAVAEARRGSLGWGAGKVKG